MKRRTQRGPKHIRFALPPCANIRPEAFIWAAPVEKPLTAAQIMKRLNKRAREELIVEVMKYVPESKEKTARLRERVRRRIATRAVDRILPETS